jgi:hypothetical protein
MKYLTVLLLILCLFQFAAGEERKKSLYSEQELSDPSSRYYVPVPYPTTRKDILADLKAQVKIHYDMYTRKKIKLGKIGILFDLLYGNNTASLRIGKIIKVKNRNSNLEKDYSWVLLVMSGNGSIEFGVKIYASGVYYISESFLKISGALGKRVLYEKSDILAMLCHHTGKKIAPGEVKNMESFSSSMHLGPWWAPVWEIILVDGRIYYYSLVKDLFYVIDEVIPWEKKVNGFFKNPMKIAPFDRILLDSIKEEIIVLKAI